jgi:phosphoribosylformimino-5-aminoimidazole carboxamide ribotide isomerase
MEIIPAIDLIDNKCVRLYQGDYHKKSVYHEDPISQAKEFEEMGIKRLHVVDLDGAKQGRPVHIKLLEKLTRDTGLAIDFGGGVRTLNHVAEIKMAGAVKVSVGSITVNQPNVFLEMMETFGADYIFPGLDVKDGALATGGWQNQSGLTIEELMKRPGYHNIRQAFCTDISKDGTLEGPAIGLYRELVEKFPAIQWVASGGVSSMADLLKLKKIGLAAAIVGKAYYENRITMEELKENGFI